MRVGIKSLFKDVTLSLDNVSNLFLMCRECHDLAPNTTIRDIFFSWVRSQSFRKRELDKVQEALHVFGIGEIRWEEFFHIIQSAKFEKWARGKLGIS